MQKTRSINLLKQVLEQLENQQQTDIANNVSFREKDIRLLKQECTNQLNKFRQVIAEKQQLDHKIIRLKEILYELNPEALEEIQRDCYQKMNSPNEVKHQGQEQKERGKARLSRASKKRNDKKKRRREKIYYG